MLVAVALSAAVALVVGMLAGQVEYAGLRAPLRALGDPTIRHAIGLSLGTATASAAIALALAVPAAYGLARYRFPGAAALDLLLDVPVVLSPIAVGVSLLLVFRGGAGRWVEDHLLRFVFEVPGIILAQLPAAMGLSIRVLKAAFQNVDVRYEQVARFLGCTPWGAFRKVTLPMARRGLLAAFILAWAKSVGEFGATVTLAGAVPGKTETIPVSIYLRLAGVDLVGAVALMLVLSSLSLVVLLGVRLLGAKP